MIAIGGLLNNKNHDNVAVAKPPPVALRRTMLIFRARSLLRFAHKTVKIFVSMNIFTLQTPKAAR
jgi:hypothetical protein